MPLMRESAYERFVRLMKSSTAHYARDRYPEQIATVLHEQTLWEKVGTKPGVKGYFNGMSF